MSFAKDSILVFVGVPVGIGFLLYFIPKKLGYPKLGKYLTLGFALILVIFIFINVFEDELFTKSSAKKLLKEQNIELLDRFSLDKNESGWDFSSSYHHFTLTISEKDKEKIIKQIKNSTDFKPLGEPVRHFDKFIDTIPKQRIYQNHETKEFFIREFYEYQQKNYLYIYRKIKIDKKLNKLFFEEDND